jgi:hypothetical protein
VGLSASPKGPQPLGTPLTLTATPTNGGQIEYQFSAGYKSGASYLWTTCRPYAAARSCSWTPPAARSWTLRVYAREVGSTKSYDVYKTLAYLIYPTPPTAVALAAGPAWTGGTTTLRAVPTGGTHVQYRFRAARKVGGTLAWTTLREFSDAASIAWTPAVADTYTLAVYAHEVGSPKSYDCYKTISCPVTATPRSRR